VTAAETDRDVSLKSLVELDGEAFVRNAYRRLLGREVDAAALEQHLGSLKLGMPKEVVLGRIRFSDEGRRLGVEVPGLELRYSVLEPIWVRYRKVRAWSKRSAAALPPRMAVERSKPDPKLTAGHAMPPSEGKLAELVRDIAVELERLRAEHAKDVAEIRRKLETILGERDDEPLLRGELHNAIVTQRATIAALEREVTSLRGQLEGSAQAIDRELARLTTRVDGLVAGDAESTRGLETNRSANGSDAPDGRS